MKYNRLIFGNEDSKTEQERVISRDVSIKQITKNQQQSIDDFKKDTNGLLATLNNIDNLFNIAANQISAVKWASKQLILFMKELYDIVYVYKQDKVNNGATGPKPVPDMTTSYVFTNLYNAYKKLGVTL